MRASIGIQPEFSVNWMARTCVLAISGNWMPNAGAYSMWLGETRWQIAPRASNHFRGIETSVNSTPCVAIIPMRLPLNRIGLSGFSVINLRNARCPVPSPESGCLLSERTADHHIDKVFRQLLELLGMSFKGLFSLRW